MIIIDGLTKNFRVRKEWLTSYGHLIEQYAGLASWLARMLDCWA